MADFSGRVVIVTGASRGIGRGIALACGDRGASVVAAARTVGKLAETCAEVEERGGKALAVPCDVSELDDIQRCVETAVRRFGRIDVLVNNAQTIEYLFLNDSSDQTMMDAMVSGPIATFRFMKAAFPHLANARGVVVNVGSDAMHLPNTSRYGPYNAAKAGIEALTRTAADEWGVEGIRCFMMNPSAESVMTANWRAREPDKYAAAVAKMPGGRLGDPYEDIGRPLVGMIEDADRWNGKTVAINAGGIFEVIEEIAQGENAAR